MTKRQIKQAEVKKNLDLKLKKKTEGEFIKHGLRSTEVLCKVCHHKVVCNAGKWTHHYLGYNTHTVRV